MKRNYTIALYLKYKFFKCEKIEKKHFTYKLYDSYLMDIYDGSCNSTKSSDEIFTHIGKIVPIG